MSLWGNRDSKTASGTIASIDGDGNVVGSGTSFTTQARVGNYIYADDKEFIIVEIIDNTHCTVLSGVHGGVIDVGSSYSYTLSEKPAYVAGAECSDSSGDSGDSSKVYGVDIGEMTAGGDNVTSVAVASGKTRYLEIPAVTFSGGGGSSAAATAAISSGSVSAITVTNVGSAYTSVPSVAIAKPKRTIPTSGVNIASESIIYATHGLSIGEEVKYFNGGGASATGLTSSTSYYVSSLGFGTGYFRLAASTGAVAGRTGLTTVAISGTGGQFTCAATTLAAGDHIRISGTIGGTGSIDDYTDATIYEVTAVTGTSPNVTGFTIAAEDLTALTTTVGTPTGLTYTPYTIVMLSGTGNNAQYFEIQAADDQATAIASLGAGTGSGSGTNLTHAGWVRRTVGTGGRAGRVQYETLVAMSSISGDQADDLQLPDAT